MIFYFNYILFVVIRPCFLILDFTMIKGNNLLYCSFIFYILPDLLFGIQLFEGLNFYIGVSFHS